MMRIEIKGFNYTGAYFRGFDDGVDGRHVRLVVSGEESAICNFVLDNFAYGANDGIQTADQLAEAYATNLVSNADGCGYVYHIADADSGRVLWAEECFDGLAVDPLMDLGEFEIDKSRFNDVNHKVRELLKSK